MARGYALNIGLNSVDPKHYQGWDGQLTACEFDAEDMSAIARSCEISSEVLLTKKATRAAVLEQINKAAKVCKPGDLFFLTYSGHGGQLPDLSDDEPDGYDETWCLYDGELVDDELHLALGDFAEGVRILVLSDSCHSGTVTKMLLHRAMAATGSGDGPSPKLRFMPWDVAARVYRANRAFYDPILKSEKLRKAEESVKASVLLISGCQDNQFSLDGMANGLFTGTLLKVWKDGRFRGGYRAFHRGIVNRMPPTQTPNFFWASNPNSSFARQQVFSV
jgi:hypothetical protein